MEYCVYVNHRDIATNMFPTVSVSVWSFPQIMAVPGLCSTLSVYRSFVQDPTYLTAPSTPLTTTAGRTHHPVERVKWSLRTVRTCITLNLVLHFGRWTRISIPLPNAALTETTRFHWKQSGTGLGNMWAIDNGQN